MIFQKRTTDGARRLRLRNSARVGLCVTTLSVGLVVGVNGTSSAAPKPKAEVFNITIGYAVANILCTPLWVGVADGIFAKHGLNVKLVVLSSSNLVSQAIATNSITVGTSTSIGLIQPYSAGEGIESVSEYINGFPAAISISTRYAAAHGITANSSAKDIAHALIGSTEAAGAVSIKGQAQVIMNSLGVGPSEYHVVQVANQPATLVALETGQADWLLASYPTPFQLVQNGSAFIALNAHNTPAFLTKQLDNIIVANTAYASAHPALMKKIVSAISDATSYTLHHEAQVISIVQSNLPGYTRPQIQKSLAVTQFASSPLQNENIWRSSAAFDIKSGQLKPPTIIKEGGIWTNAYA